MAVDILVVVCVFLSFHYTSGWGEAWAGNAGLHRQNTSGYLIPTSVAFPTILLQGLMLLSLGGAAVFPAAAGLLFAGVGLYDDWRGCRDVRQRTIKGWRGHLGALWAGQLTSGAVKVFAGGGGALLLASLLARGMPVSVTRDALVVALSASVANALDVRRGRAGKVLLLGFASLVALNPGVASFLLVVPVLVFLLRDLPGQVMMGDAGANGWGAMLGAAVVVNSPPTVRWAMLAVLVVVQVAAETVTLSRVIQKSRVLYVLDEIGS